MHMISPTGPSAARFRHHIFLGPSGSNVLRHPHRQAIGQLDDPVCHHFLSAAQPVDNLDAAILPRARPDLCSLGLPLIVHDINEAVLAVPQYGKRSEEHTSELQSLMRISYAVFCLTTNNTT